MRRRERRRKGGIGRKGEKIKRIDKGAIMVCDEEIKEGKLWRNEMEGGEKEREDGKKGRKREKGVRSG